MTLCLGRDHLDMTGVQIAAPCWSSSRTKNGIKHDLQLAAVRESTGVDAELIVAARYRETCAIINLPDTQRRRVQPASPGSDRSSRNDEDKRTSGHIMTGHRGS
ncbi:Hypothetical protein SMAX5B_000369 [Scophthalmus maximus]|uniref:Uncharacterized protein n=1 Tax=Scophthalmus maximus TaxID=52904 RepID=A0A2U9CKD0_SCOMX|nr:Hypothetical protein SMAX5B_000369 [Scophthalmus maximus]